MIGFNFYIRTQKIESSNIEIIMKRRTHSRSPNNFIKNVSEPWFSLIKVGAKRIEGRLNKGDFSKMEKGDTILFKNSDLGFDRECLVEVVSMQKYNDFRSYLVKTLRHALPTVDTVDQGISIYRQFYSAADEKKYGVLAIKIKVL